MSIWKAFVRGMQSINKIFLYLAVATVIIMALIITVEVVARSAFNTSTMIADEYSGYCLAALTFFGGAYTLSQDGFLKVEILYNRFRGVYKKIVDTFNGVIALVYMSFVIYFCSLVFYNSLVNHIVSITISQTPLALPQSVMVIGSVLLFVEIVVQLVHTLQRPIDKLGG